MKHENKSFPMNHSKPPYIYQMDDKHTLGNNSLHSLSTYALGIGF